MSVLNRESVAPTPPAVWWRTCEPLEACRVALHKKPFRLAHSLAGHPLFALETLLGVAQEAAKRKGDLYCDAGLVTVSDRWGKIPIPDMPVSEVLKRIETAGAWIVLKHVETDPRYKAVLDEWTDFARDFAGPEGARLLGTPEMIVLITSPHRVTPCHFDREINCLCQLHGTKDIWVADLCDTTQKEIECHYGVGQASGNCTPQTEERATKFLLEPGVGVHIPTHAKHWVKNHDNVSVSLSLNFEFPHWKQADVYQANHYLRRLGLSPRPPGRSVVIDRTKAAAVAVSRSALRVARAVKRLGGVFRWRAHPSLP